MKNEIITLLFSITATLSVAQKDPIKFGEIPIEDMMMTVYDKDSSAAAVILSDYGEARVIDFLMTYDRHVRIKILSKEGLDWANGSIITYQSLYGSGQLMLNLKASTYSLEKGKIVEAKMSKDGVFIEKINQAFDAHKFTLPNVKEGSVIEYSYTISSTYFAAFPSWQFQYEIPVRWSEYWAEIPEFFEYEKYMQGYVPVTSYEMEPKFSRGIQVFYNHWISTYIPAFRPEPYMTNQQDFLSKINFSLSHVNGQFRYEILGSWSKFNTTLLESDYFGGVLKGSFFLKNKSEQLVKEIVDPQIKISTIYNYIKSTLEWNKSNEYRVYDLKKAFEKRKGSSADINIALACMLSKVGITVDLVLLSTRDHGFIRRNFPSERQFNYVICEVRLGDRILLLDATEKLLPMNILPERCLNGEGLVISELSHGWINIQSNVKAKTVINAEFGLLENGELKGKLIFKRDGYDAFSMRNEYQKNGREVYLENFLRSKSWQVEESTFQDIAEVEKPVKEIHELIVSDHASINGNVIYLNPLIVHQIEQNPFKSESRYYPVDFGSSIEKMYMCKIELPEGYTVDELPESRIIVLPGNAARYTYNATVVGKVINVMSNFQINKNLFLPEEYQNLREFYDRVLAKEAEQIVLKKK